jgi:hypothetical protein
VGEGESFAVPLHNLPLDWPDGQPKYPWRAVAVPSP